MKTCVWRSSSLFSTADSAHATGVTHTLFSSKLSARRFSERYSPNRSRARRIKVNGFPVSPVHQLLPRD
jgi:hypothetical protein